MTPVIQRPTSKVMTILQLQTKTFSLIISTLYNFPLRCYAEDVVHASTEDVFVRMVIKENFARLAL